MNTIIELTRGQLITIAETVSKAKRDKYAAAQTQVNPDIEWCDVRDIVALINNIIDPITDFLHLQLTKSPDDVPCIEMIRAPSRQREIVRSIVMNQWTDSEDYKMKQGAIPFIQCDTDEYVLVEFFGHEPAIQEFVDYLNKKLQEQL
jgi:hypothetical protein